MFVLFRMIEEASKSGKVTVEKRQLFMEMSKLMLLMQSSATHTYAHGHRDKLLIAV